jgi:hypothetical protein
MIKIGDRNKIVSQKRVRVDCKCSRMRDKCPDEQCGLTIKNSVAETRCGGQKE